MFFFKFKLKQATSSISVKLKWLNNKHLVDLDFADNIALIDMTQTRMQEITHGIEKIASHVGLYINVAETKVMPVSNEYNTSGDILVEGNLTEYVEEFCYPGSITATAAAMQISGPKLEKQIQSLHV